jgi:large repetitive protein
LLPGVLGNDADEDGDLLTVSLVSGPATGIVTLLPNGSFVYLPPLFSTAPSASSIE